MNSVLVSMNSRVFLIVIICTAQSTNISKKCIKSDRAYPADKDGLKIDPRPSDPSPWLKCDMLVQTCCNTLTEFYMNQRAVSDFPVLLFSVINDRLKKVNDLVRSFSGFHAAFYNAVAEFALKKEGVSMTDEYLARFIVGHYIKNACLAESTSALNLVNTVQTTLVPNITKELSPFYTGIAAVQSALNVSSQETLSPNCIEEVMRNGMFTGGTFDRVMCQVCHKDTTHLAPCRNTCRNVARRCLGNLVDIYSRLKELVVSLSDNQRQLYDRISLSDAIFNRIEKEIWVLFDRDSGFKNECWTGKPNISTRKDSTAEYQMLSGILESLHHVFEESADYACFASTSNDNCWTAAHGFTRNDDREVSAFDSKLASAIAKKSKDALEAESLLNDTIVMFHNLVPGDYDENNKDENSFFYINEEPATLTDKTKIIDETYDEQGGVKIGDSNDEDVKEKPCSALQFTSSIIIYILVSLSLLQA